MGTTRRTRFRTRTGFLLLLLGLLILGPYASARVLAQDEQATPADAAETTEEKAAEPTPDRERPVIAPAPDIVVEAADAAGAVVAYLLPAATDETDGPVAVVCDPAPETVFPIGRTLVTCRAQDAAGNAARRVTFTVTVSPLPEPTPTETPKPTEESAPTEESSPTEESAPTDEPESTETPDPTNTPVPAETPAVTATPTETPTPSETTTPADDDGTATPTSTPKPTKTPQPSATPTVPATPTAEALELPWPPPDAFVLNLDGGPVGLLAAIWGNDEYPISQEFGHTAFSVAHPGWYAYGADYGLDGYEHTGLDIGMLAGTPLYSPVDGVVKIAGGTPYFTFYGNGALGVGELLIETEDGDEVVLGHMGRIAVEEGDRVKIGQFVGLSGGENGDHLHLEVRELQPEGGLRILDPRKSFLVDALEAAAKRKAATPEATTEGGAPRERPID
ncbi:MAG: hypothetical protein QOF01_33 [Thermomicrobiales bacterium]|nr:hypothetical protein [Thermomicrobiales bacterium]